MTKFQRREIRDRIASGDDVFQLENLPDGRTRLIPKPDAIIEPGTRINSELLQPIEDFLDNLKDENGSLQDHRGLVANEGSLNGIRDDLKYLDKNTTSEFKRIEEKIADLKNNMPDNEHEHNASCITDGRFLLSRMPTSENDNRVLKVVGRNTDPIYAQIDMQNDVDGILSIENGGTGANEALAAFNALGAGPGHRIIDGALQVRQSITIDQSISTNTLHLRSDKRLKENIRSYETDKSILDLVVKSFNYIGNGKKTIGFIAQELQDYFPELVVENEDGFLSIEETKLSYLLLLEMKKTRTELDKLKKKIGGIDE